MVMAATSTVFIMLMVMMMLMFFMVMIVMMLMFFVVVVMMMLMFFVVMVMMMMVVISWTDKKFTKQFHRHDLILVLITILGGKPYYSIFTGEETEPRKGEGVCIWPGSW